MKNRWVRGLSRDASLGISLGMRFLEEWRLSYRTLPKIFVPPKLDPPSSGLQLTRSHANLGTAMVATAVVGLVGVPYVWISDLAHAELQNSQSLRCKHVCRARWLLRPTLARSSTARCGHKQVFACHGVRQCAIPRMSLMPCHTDMPQARTRF